MGVGAVGLACLLCLALAAPAGATTFCVPGFHATCPDSGGNVAEDDLETAMGTSDNDGNADRILIAGVTLTDTDTFDVGSGGDDLEIAGAGPGTGLGATRLTSSLVGGNNYVVNLSNRAVTMRDLTIVIPDSFGDDVGTGLQAVHGTIQNVDIESRNLDSDGASMGADASFTDGRLYGAAGGTIDTGFELNASSAGSLEIVRTTIEDTNWGVAASSAVVPVYVRRSRIVDAAPYGVIITGGGIANVYNTVIESSGGRALSATSFGAAPGILNARGVTMVKTGGPAAPAVEVFVNAGAAGSLNVFVHDSIIRGFDTTYLRQSGAGGAAANLTLRYSNFADTGTATGTGLLTLGPANIDADPLFTSDTDFHLLAGSPSIDAADPMPSVALTDDFDGLSRPFDGNADGVARRDMGAFEYRPAPDPPANPQPPVGTKKKCKKKKRKGKGKAGAAAKKRKKKCKRKKRKGKR